MKYIIELLDRTEWQGHTLYFSYISEYYYDVILENKGENFVISMVKKPFSEPLHRVDTQGDKLYAEHWNDAEAYGIIENNKLIAVIEFCVEKWSNRMRVTELWIDNAYRRKGIGTELMNFAKDKAVHEKCRAIILETQSCNAPAISFYLAQGFNLIGFDTCCYSNSDIEKKEVRLELGYFLQ